MTVSLMMGLMMMEVGGRNRELYSDESRNVQNNLNESFRMSCIELGTSCTTLLLYRYL